MSNTKNPRVRRILAAAAGAVVALTLSLGAAVVMASPANAEGRGAGYHDPGGLGDLGAYIAADGSQVYCLQLGQQRTPGDHETDGGSYGQWGSDANANARVSYVLTKYGQTSDNNTAAAVAMYVWDQLDNAAYNSHGMSGDIYYVSRAPASQRASILSLLGNLRSEAGGITAGASPHGALNFNIATTDNYQGTLTVSGIGAATGTVTLTNGIFTATGTNQLSGVHDGQALPVQGTPPDGTPDYRISATGVFFDPNSYAGNVKVYNVLGGGQASAGPGEHGSFQLTGEDPFDRSATYQPVVTTKVSSIFVKPGAQFSDVVHFTTAADSDGTNNPWPRRASGKYRIVTAHATIYGPFTSQPATSAAAPSAAPPAGTATITTTDADGPTRDYTATSSQSASSSGYYTWVWTISRADQPADTQLYIGDGYSFTDQFGQVAESSIVPPDVTTKAQATGVLGIPVRDTATVSGTVFAGAQLGFEAYLQQTAADGSIAKAVCDSTTRVYSSPLQPVATAGDYPSPDAQLPIGTVYWVETLYDSRGNAVQSGECGTPGETSVISQLSVTTKATPKAYTTTSAADTATITGTINAGDTVEFAAYRGPQPVCNASTLAWTSPAVALTTGVVNGQDVAGPGTRFSQAGTYLWIETVKSSNGTVVAQGRCGEAGESTKVTFRSGSHLALTGMNQGGIGIGGLAGAAAVVAGLGMGAWALLRRRDSRAGEDPQQ